MNNEEMTKLLHAKGAGAVKDYIASMETPVESANAYNILVNHLYWGLWAVNQAATEGCDDFDYLLYSSHRIGEYYKRKEAMALE